MTKAFSRIVLGLVLALTGAAAISAPGNDKLQIADKAPDSYVVKKGDTLWAISGVFLKQPWRWPEVWKLNQEQIHNPHLIYPGQVVVLDRTGPSLMIGRNVTMSSSSESNRLSPAVRSSDVQAPISAISLDAIRPFLTQALITDTPDSERMPTVVAIQEDRVIAGVGDTIYAKNVLEDETAVFWNVYHRAKPITNPFDDKDVLGYESLFVATAKVAVSATANTVTELKVVSSKSEVNTTDRMLPVQKEELIAVPPHAPTVQVQAGVAEIYDGVRTAGRNSVIAISAGRNFALEPGHVLAIVRNNGSTTYRGDAKPEVLNLPDSQLGLVYVFKVFNRVAYGLVVESSGPVKVGDKITNP
jgi:hypothetical protein